MIYRVKSGVLSGFAVAALTLGIRPACADSVDFQSSVYVAGSSVVGVDGWARANTNTQGTFVINNSEAPNLFLRATTLGTSVLTRAFPAQTSTLDLLWRWKSNSANARLCVGVGSGATATTLSQRAGACTMTGGAVDGTGLVRESATNFLRRANIWYAMRLRLDNLSNTYAVYIDTSEDRSTETRLVGPSPMNSIGALTRVFLAGENVSGGIVDVDDIWWKGSPTYVWIGGVLNSSWSNPNNWSDLKVPDSTSNVVFNASGLDCSVDISTSVRTITFSPDYSGRFNLGASVLNITGNADFTTSGEFNQSTGYMRFSGSQVQTVAALTEKTVPSIVHDGSGTLRFDRMDRGSLSTNDFTQSNGSIDFNGYNLVVNGDFRIHNGGPKSLLNLGGRDVSIGENAVFSGQAASALLALNPSETWNLYVSGKVESHFAAIGNSNCAGSQGFAYQSNNAGGNNGWIFASVPVILSGPQSQAVLAGQAATFKTSAASDLPATFSWLRNNVPIAGAADSVYTVSSAKKADSGALFICVVSNSAGSATTAPAGLGVSLPAPTASPAPQEIVDSLSIKLSTVVPGAGLVYSTNGSAFQTYSQAVLLRDSTLLRARTVLNGDSSAVGSWIYPKLSLSRTQTPDAIPTGRNFSNTLSVALTSKVSGSLIFYTLDGSVPDTATARRYTGPIALDTSTVIRAVAVKPGLSVSAPHSETYVLVPDAPTATPLGGVYAAPIQIAFSASTPKARIYYSLDGNTPGPETGTLYSQPVFLDRSAVLNAVATVGSQRGPLLTSSYSFVQAGTKTLAGGGRIDFGANYSLSSPSSSAPPVQVDVLPVDSLNSLYGFRDVGFAVRVSSSGGAFPQIFFNSPSEDKRFFYYLSAANVASFETNFDILQLPKAGIYFLATDTLPPQITLSGEAFTADDSTRAVFALVDNVSNLVVDLERSDDPNQNRVGIEVDASQGFQAVLKNPPGVLRPLTLRLKVSDHMLSSWFPSDSSSRYFLAQKASGARSPEVLNIGNNSEEPWDLASVPLKLSPPLTLSALRGNTGAGDLTAAVWDDAAAVYNRLGANDEFKPGQSYWLANSSLLSSLAFPSLKTVSSGDAGPVQVLLHPGWNQVSNPVLGVLYWPVPWDQGGQYDFSQVRRLSGYDADAGSYVSSDSLEPWRGYFVFHRGLTDTMVSLLNSPPLSALAKPAKISASQASVSLLLNMGRALPLRLGTSPLASDGAAFEDDPQPPVRGERSPRLWAIRDGRKLETDLVRWTSGSIFHWRVVAKLPQPRGGAKVSAIPAPEGATLQTASLPEGYEVWAVSAASGLRFSLAAGDIIPLSSVRADTLDIYAGPVAALNGRLQNVPQKVGAFRISALATPRGFSLRLRSPEPVDLRWKLCAPDGRVRAQGALDLAGGVYELPLAGSLPSGLYLLKMDWRSGKTAGKTARKLAVP